TEAVESALSRRPALRVAATGAARDAQALMSWSRRTFLRASLVGSSGILAPGGLDVVLAAIAHGPQRAGEGFGPLVPDPAGLLDLPAGFQYRMFSPGVIEREREGAERFTSLLGNGEPTPGLH